MIKYNKNNKKDERIKTKNEKIRVKKKKKKYRDI